MYQLIHPSDVKTLHTWVSQLHWNVHLLSPGVKHGVGVRGRGAQRLLSWTVRGHWESPVPGLSQGTICRKRLIYKTLFMALLIYTHSPLTGWLHKRIYRIVIDGYYPLITLCCKCGSLSWEYSVFCEYKCSTELQTLQPLWGHMLWVASWDRWRLSNPLRHPDLRGYFSWLLVCGGSLLQSSILPFSCFGLF